MKILAPLLLVACHTAWTESDQQGLRVLTTEEAATARGRIALDFEVEEGEDALLLTLAPATDTARSFVFELYSPTGDRVFLASDFWESPQTRTTAAFSASITNLVWPITREDPPLEAGRWRVDARVDNSEPTDIHLALRPADVSASDSLTVEIVMLGDLIDDPEVMRATLAAVDHWKNNIYGPAGIDLIINISAFDADKSQQSPQVGEAVYHQISASLPFRTIPLVMVDRMLDGVGILGVSGGIPGALAATPRSVVAVSALEASGGDRVFSQVEQDLLGETMAHEVAHYLGLFHPMELPTAGDEPSTWDSLADTPDCDRLAQCDELLSSNLMYPTPVCDPGANESFGCSKFISQIDITADQRDSVDHFAAVD